MRIAIKFLAFFFFLSATTDNLYFQLIFKNRIKRHNKVKEKCVTTTTEKKQVPKSWIEGFRHNLFIFLHRLQNRHACWGQSMIRYAFEQGSILGCISPKNSSKFV